MTEGKLRIEQARLCHKNSDYGFHHKDLDEVTHNTTCSVLSISIKIKAR